MRFDNGERHTILQPRDQRRLLFMGISLMVVIFAIKVAAKPEFWQRMFPDKFAENVADNSGDNGLSEIDLGNPLDNLSAPLGPGEFLSPAPTVTSNNQGLPAEDPTAPDSAPQVVSRIDLTRGIVVPKTSPLLEQQSPFPPEVLATIRDDALQIPTHEADAWFHMLAVARDEEPGRMTAAAVQQPDYRVLMQHPRNFRGVPVQLTGDLRRLTTYGPRANRFGVDNLYDAWLFTKSSGTNPIHIVCSRADQTLPLKEAYDKPIPVTVTGFFFKREGYAAQDRKLHLAPLVLAGSIQRRPMADLNIAADDGTLQQILTWFAVFVGIVLVVTLWNFAVSDWYYRTGRTSQLARPQPNVDFSGVESTDIGQVLRRLSDEA